MPFTDEPNGGHPPDNGGVPDDSHTYTPGDYTYGSSQPGGATPPPPPSGGGRRFLPPPDKPTEETEEEDEGMLRMSFLGHLEELRRRIFLVVGGFAVAFLAAVVFAKKIWLVVSAPAVSALKEIGIHPPNLTQLTPMEGFNVIWVKVPVLCSIFLASPWILYQVWAFISPGLYKKERRWAVPFVVCTAGLFISGGLFAYFVVFRLGLVFLLGIGRDVNVSPMVSISEYFDLFVNVTLGIGVVFELPILIFFLALLRLVTPKFLISNSRYAILIIVIIAAVVTPTPDIFNLLLFATPMVLLFYVGVFAAYLLYLSREGKKFPWGKVLPWIVIIILVLAIASYIAVTKFQYHFSMRWPFLIK